MHFPLLSHINIFHINIIIKLEPGNAYMHKALLFPESRQNKVISYQLGYRSASLKAISFKHFLDEHLKGQVSLMHHP